MNNASEADTLTQAGRTNVAIYTCTKFVVCFVNVDTNNSVR